MHTNHAARDKQTQQTYNTSLSGIHQHTSVTHPLSLTNNHSASDTSAANGGGKEVTAGGGEGRRVAFKYVPTEDKVQSSVFQSRSHVESSY